MKKIIFVHSICLLLFLISGCASQVLWSADGGKIKTLYKISSTNFEFKGKNPYRRWGSKEFCFSYSIDDLSKDKNVAYPPLNSGCFCYMNSNDYPEFIEKIFNGPVSINIIKINAIATKKLMIGRNFGARVLDKVILARDLGPKDIYIKKCKGEPIYNLHWEIKVNLPINHITFNNIEEIEYIKPSKKDTHLINAYFKIIKHKVFEKYKKEYNDSYLMQYDCIKPLGWIESKKSKISSNLREKIYSGILLKVNHEKIKTIKILFNDDDMNNKMETVNLILNDNYYSYTFSSIVFNMECGKSNHSMDNYSVLQNYPLGCIFRLQRIGYKYNMPTRLLLTPIAIGFDIATFPFVSIIGLSGCGPPP
ncbi:MAG: hypothetical protein ABIK92_16225 [Pseudomonadota bacterium]